MGAVHGPPAGLRRANNTRPRPNSLTASADTLGNLPPDGINLSEPDPPSLSLWRGKPDCILNLAPNDSLSNVKIIIPLPRRTGDPEKVALARRLRAETTMSLKWIASELQTGS